MLNYVLNYVLNINNYTGALIIIDLSSIGLLLLMFPGIIKAKPKGFALIIILNYVDVWTIEYDKYK